MTNHRLSNSKVLRNAKIKFNIYIVLVDLITIILTYFLMPIVQNFPPLTEDLGFQEMAQPVTHIEQYTIIFVLGITIHLLSFKIIMKKIKTYINKYEKDKEISIDEILEIRKECQNIPYKVLIVQMLLFISIGVVFNLIMLVQLFTIIKFTLMIIALTSIVSLLTFIATQKYLNNILLSTYDVTLVYKRNIGYRITNTKSLILQTMPFIAVILIILSLVGYSKAIDIKGQASANYYRAYLDKTEIDTNIINKEYLKSKLKEIPLNNENDYYFIITPNDEQIYTSKEGGNISDFVLEYRDYFYDDFKKGMLYENFGIDEQIYAIKITDSRNNNWNIGFKFSIVDEALLLYYFAIIIGLIIVYGIILLIWARNMSSNVTRVSERLKRILESEHIDKEDIVPIMSNDELADLAYYYNKIQEKLINQQDIIQKQGQLVTLGELARRNGS